jgi:hypothetical protein
VLKGVSNRYGTNVAHLEGMSVFPFFIPALGHGTEEVIS